MRRLLRRWRLDWREHLHVTFTLIGPNGIDGARLGDLGELERIEIIFDVDRGLFERALAKEGVRRGRGGRGAFRLGLR